MGKIITKLRSQAGESFTETLVALLISVLSLTMLAGAIASAGSAITKGRNTLDKYYSVNEEAGGVVKMSGTGADGTVTIQQSGDELEDQSISVHYCSNATFCKTPVVAY